MKIEDEIKFLAINSNVMKVGNPIWKKLFPNFYDDVLLIPKFQP